MLARVSRYEYDASRNRLLRTDILLEFRKEAGSEDSDRPLAATLKGDRLNIVFLEGTDQTLLVYEMADIISALSTLPSCIYYYERIPEWMEAFLPRSLLSLSPSYCGTHLSIIRRKHICGFPYVLPSSDAIGRIRSIATGTPVNGAMRRRWMPSHRLFAEVSSFVMTDKSLCRLFKTSPAKIAVNCPVNFEEECSKSNHCLNVYNSELHSPSIAVDNWRNTLWYIKDYERWPIWPHADGFIKVASISLTCERMYPIKRCRHYSPEMMRVDNCVWCMRNGTYHSVLKSDVPSQCVRGEVENDACQSYMERLAPKSVGSSLSLTYGIVMSLLVALPLAAALAFLVVRQYRRSKEWEIPCDEVQFGCQIGQGSFGVVFRAYRYGDVAVKQLFAAKPRSSEHRAFRNEIRLIKSLRHTNVLGLLGVVTEPQLAIVTDWCHGSLYQQIHVAEAAYGLTTVLRLCRQIAEGMTYLHSKGVLHR